MSEQTDEKQTRISKNWLLALGLAFGAVLLLFIVNSPTRPDSTTLDTSTKEFPMIGEKAPDFTLLDQEGSTVSLADYQGKNLVIFFNEGVMCYPSCWDQIASLGTNPKLNNDEVATLSMVIDTRDEWNGPYEKMPAMLTETMLFDTTKEVARAYDMLNFPSSMHPGDRPGHSYVVIDGDGVVRYIKDDPQMGINDPWLEEMVSQLQ